MEKNRKLDPMDPKIFDIPRPSIDSNDFMKPDWYVDYGAHNSLRDQYQIRRKDMEEDTKKRNK